MKLIKAYTSVSLVLRIVIGLVIGAILALVVPQATWIGMFGTIFVGALKAIAPVLVLVLVSSSLAQSREKLGSQFVTIVILYLLSTFLAAVIAVVGSMLFPVTIFLASTTLVFMSNATYIKSDTSPSSSISMPCHVVNKNCQSPDVTATLPLLFRSAWNILPSRNSQMPRIILVTI